MAHPAAAYAFSVIGLPVLAAIPTWNECLLTRVSLNDPARCTLPIALQALRSEQTIQYNTLMPGALIVVIPLVILFLSAQRYFWLDTRAAAPDSSTTEPITDLLAKDHPGTQVRGPHSSLVDATLARDLLGFEAYGRRGVA